MNSIDLLKERKNALLENSKDIREKISSIIDEGSFVELNTFSFAKNNFYGNEDSLGVITGYATIEGCPIYVVAQNSKVLNGGLSYANCKKICECVEKAGSSEIPVLYLLDSQGVQIGEGVSVLEGISEVLAYSNRLKGVAPQIAVAVGNVLGSSAILADNCDFTFVVGDACISYASPAVIAASSKGKDGVANAKNGVATFKVKTISEVKEKIVKIFDTLPKFAGYEVDGQDDLNRTAPALNAKVTVDGLIEATFDKDSFIKMNEGFEDSVITGIGRAGGISVASIIMADDENGVDLTLSNILKIKNFIHFADENALPIILFVNSNGFKLDSNTFNSQVTTEFMNMLDALSAIKRITVVYGKAIGVSYSAFVSKASGSDYTYAFAGSKISLLDGYAGISATYGTVCEEDVDKLKAEFDASQDSFNSAKLGCVDNIIEPEFVRQYVLSALQMLIS